jgi:hypothetical protein
MHEFKVASFSLWCYRGAVVMPKWKDVDTRAFLVLKLRIIAQWEVQKITQSCAQSKLTFLSSLCHPDQNILGEGVSTASSTILSYCSA